MLERSGFKDVKYLVWDHKSVAGPNSEKEALGEMELSFIGPRRGAASWLATPTPLGSLDFVPPKSAFVVGIALKNLGEVFDDIKAFSADSNPNAFATLPAMEQAMHVNLRDDLLGQLQGEIAFALANFTPEHPEWKVILRVNDSDRLQKTLNKLLLSTPVVARRSEEEGLTYHSLMVPSSPCFRRRSPPAPQSAGATIKSIGRVIGRGDPANPCRHHRPNRGQPADRHCWPDATARQNASSPSPPGRRRRPPSGLPTSVSAYG